MEKENLKVIGFSIPPSLHALLQGEAQKKYRSMSQQMRMYLERCLKEDGLLPEEGRTEHRQ